MRFSASACRQEIATWSDAGRASAISVIREASPEHQEAACAAMRAKLGEALDELLGDAKDAPWLAHVAFATAVLTLAHAGIRVIKGV